MVDYYHYPDPKWCEGHNVPVALLRSIKDELYETSAPFILTPASQAVNLFTVETQLLSGRVRGDGLIEHELSFGFMPMPTLQAFIARYFSDLTKSVPMTLYLRMHEIGDEYFRFNFYMIRPTPTKDYTIEGGRATDVKLRLVGGIWLPDITLYPTVHTNTNVFRTPVVTQP